MKRLLILFLTLVICLSVFACENNSPQKHSPDSGYEVHCDSNSDKKCDECGISVVTTFDFYAINDLHGKFVTSSNTTGVEGLTTYLKTSAALDDNPIFFSSGDMWQGGAQSNLTKGAIVTEWMNSLGFASMTLGNHEFDWGEQYIEDNASLASFPFLAINIYEKGTDKPVDYCQSSVMVECDGLQVGIIGAIGDCYSSISADKVENIYFKTGAELTSLVKAESQKLRNDGADIIVYSLHDGASKKPTGEVISNSALMPYYDTSLSSGYVDIVFEGHSHIGYTVRDGKNIYHLQNSGDNGSISHAELEYNFANGDINVNEAEQVPSYRYQQLESDSVVSELLEKYKNEVSKADEVLGKNIASRNETVIRSTVAELYFEAGNERWGDKYDIVLGGGFMSVRSPGYLRAGDITYADLQAILPFDNEIVLCSVKGRDLLNKFINTNNSSYSIYYGDYGNSIKGDIDYNATYYLITDTYTSYYSYNNLTVVEKYGSDVFARDLLAEYIKAGNWGE